MCATLTVDIDQKIEADLKRVSETTQPIRLVYCTTQSLTEHACDKIAASVRQLIPSVQSVVVLGQIQLVELAERFEQTIRKHYVGEIHNIETALLSVPTTGAEPEKIGLRLALISHSGLLPVWLTPPYANPACLSTSMGLRYPSVECRRVEL